MNDRHGLPPEFPETRRRLKKRREREQRIRHVLIFVLILLIILMAFGLWLMLRGGNADRSHYAPGNLSYGGDAEILFLTATDTPTQTYTPTVPTETPTVTQTPTATLTPTPTLSPTPKLRPKRTMEGNSSDQLIAAEQTMAALHYTMELTGTPAPNAWFEVMGGAVPFNASLIYDNAGCSWSGVAGILADKRGEPQIGYYVRVGLPNGEELETLSGLFPNYGESGYEITLSRPVQSFDGQLWIQVFDENRIAVSGRTYFKPSAKCDHSLTIINFRRIR